MYRLINFQINLAVITWSGDPDISTKVHPGWSRDAFAFQLFGRTFKTYQSYEIYSFSAGRLTSR